MIEILWFTGLLAIGASCGLWFFFTRSPVRKRLSLTLLLLATCFMLLVAHNKIWVGDQALSLELQRTEDRVVARFKDVAGDRVLLEKATPDVRERLREQVAGELFDPDKEELKATKDSLAFNADTDLEFRIPKDLEAGDFSAIQHRLQGKTYRRPNPRRSIFEVNLGIDLRGGVEFICRLYDEGNRRVPATDDVIRILRERLDVRGLTEPQVVRLSNGDVQVVIPGGTETEAAKTRTVLERTGRLECREVRSGTPGEIGFLGPQDVEKRGTQWRPSAAYRGKTAISAGEVILPVKPEPGEEPTKFLHLGPKRLEGHDIEKVNQTMNEGQLAVGITFTASGGNKNAEFTKEVKDKQLRNEGTGFIAFSLDGIVESHPIIREPSGRSCVIEGRFTADEVDALKTMLQAGSLTVTPHVMSQQSVGASLGAETVGRGVWSMVLSLLCVVGFIMIWYKRLGWVAMASLGSTVALTLVALSIFDATVTLPGLAGIVLGIGMAVDGNILVFERLREEMREDVDHATAIDRAYDRAFLVIFDSNLTTAIVGMILYWIGSGPIKGFGLTLTISIAAQMFGALYVGRMLTDAFVRTREHAFVRSFGSIFMISYMRWSNLTLALSGVVSVVGLTWFFMKGEDQYDIDFTGGNMVQVVFAQDMSKEQVDQAIGAAYDKNPKAADLIQPSGLQVQAYYPGGMHLLGNASRQWLFKARDVQARGIEGTKSRLEQELAKLRIRADRLRDAANEESGDARKATLEEAAKLERGDLASKQKEIALVDEQLQGRQSAFQQQLRLAFGDAIPPDGSQLATSEWKEATLTATVNVLGTKPDPGTVTGLGADLRREERFRAVEVAAAGTEKDPALTFTVTYAHAPEEGKRADLVQAFLGLLDEKMAERGLAVKKPFPSSQHFSAAVGDQMKIYAVIALAVSVIGMLFYIAARFELLFGFGTIISEVHDVLITVAFLPILGVRVDLNVVAALLTIIGYSINDTIVVYDRIRENIPLMPSRTLRDVIDISIGQTMSRTVLTGGGTLLSIVVLTLIGGESLGGFAKTLLVGLISGTYSSVFIAAPTLVWFARGRTTAELLQAPEKTPDDDLPARPSAGEVNLPAN